MTDFCPSRFSAEHVYLAVSTCCSRPNVTTSGEMLLPLMISTLFFFHVTLDTGSLETLHVSTNEESIATCGSETDDITVMTGASVKNNVY